MLDENEKLDLFYKYGLNIDKRQIVFTSSIDTETSTLFIKNLNILKNIESDDYTIDIIYSSYGGNWEDGMAIYDYITAMKKDGWIVNLYCVGMVASMGVVILQAASNRYSLQNTKFLIHHGTSSISGETQHKEAIALAKYEESLEKEMLQILGKTKSGIQKITSLIDKEQEVYLDTKEALKLKLIDKIVTTIP
jgi:ATP-dependent Clp endopeptidase proteolytic subunit ClpP